jgi:peptidoglycan/LPS O-acetylase OafA/YrhL
MTTSSSPVGSREHFPRFDGLRALAVAFVLIGHLVQMKVPAMPRPILVLLGTATGSGVDIFFVLSGFLITKILLSERGKPAALRVFWLRRFLRIFPPYYLLIALLAIVAPSPAIPWCAAYLSNYYFVLSDTDGPLSPTWSLAVEEHFYLVWPIIALSLTPQRARKVVVFGIIPAAILSTVVLGLLNVEHLKMLTYKGTHARMLSLGIGCLLALSRALDDPKTRVRVMVAVFVGLLVGAVIASAAGERFHPLVTQFRFALVSLTVFIIGLYASPTSLIHRVLESRPLVALGRISYGVYLYHMPIYLAVSRLEPSGPITYSQYTALAALRVGLTLLAAQLSFKLIESPLLALKDRWSGALRERTPHAAADAA